MSGPSGTPDSRSRLLLRRAFLLLLLLLAAALLALSNMDLHPPEPTPAIAHANMRNLAVALESYYETNRQYPLPSGAWTWDSTHTVSVAAGYVPRALTTPAVHLSNLPADPFLTHPSNPAVPCSFANRYATCCDCGWILASVGPDGDADIALYEFVASATPCSPTGFFQHLGGKWPVYDPSNGLNSNGDIVRWGKR